MNSFIKSTLKISLIILLFILFISIVHYIVFPQETRCILIDFSDFKKEGRLYYNKTSSQEKIDSLLTIIVNASARVDSFWQGKLCKPKFIYCGNDDDFKKYGNPNLVPAIVKTKLGSYIVISNKGIDLDIISHEISHAELFERIGFIKYTFNIPTWFNEGLAMQVDYRSYYSEDTLKVKSNNYSNMPAVENLKTADQFYNGSREEIMLNYMTSKHEVSRWYSQNKLDNFLIKLNAGEDFDKSFIK